MLSQHLPWGTELLHCFLCGSSELQLVAFPAQGFKAGVTLPQGAPWEGYTEARGMSKLLAGHCLQSSDSTMDHSPAEMPQENPARDVLINNGENRSARIYL